MSPCVPSFKRARPALGTIVELTLSAEFLAQQSAFQLMDAAFQEIARLEKVLSKFDPESELARINLSEPGSWIAVSPELEVILKLGERVERGSHGSFRLMPGCSHEPCGCYELRGGAVLRTSVCTFDLGGIAKGFTVDRAFELLRKNAPEARIIVNAGGDLRCSHEENVELRAPGEGGDGRYSMKIENAAVATSSLQGDLSSVGDAAARYPGKATRLAKQTLSGAASVSVIALTCAAADAFAKVALLGNAPESLALDLGVQGVYLFDRQGRVLA